MNRTHIASQIAKAFLKRVKDDKKALSNLLDFLTFLESSYKRVKEIKAFMLNPTVPKEEKLKYLKTLREKFGLPEAVDGVLEHVIDLNAIRFISDVKRIYAKEMEKELRMSRAKLITAHEIPSEYIARISQILKQRLGREFELELQKDENLIGGFVVVTDSFVLDASVKRALERLGTL
ncbi:ATP synthase F1 subunit delta [Thermocrinis minervae]|uniref:ATP synthase subunit delta n=1 Tax=Thermocrinis minervae TaxID=381751 RepID=A0A1M6RRR8_9AQUI|nr:ATP synthase F1 subunit delta [Thermocrinis minervae]SHK35153.1 F-type H+-transporting ATPase subunit delta [Thermocrinis minervae]